MIELSQLFDITYGNSLDFATLKKDDFGINFISRTSKNNGISGKVETISGLNPFPAGLITVAVSGNPLESFLQLSPFYTAFHVMVLSAKEELTTQQKLFYCLCLRLNKYKYSFGRQANRTLATLIVPSTDEIPAWVESFPIPEIPKAEPAINVAENLNTDAWHWYPFSELFTPQRGDNINIVAIKDKHGTVPVISALTSNNGVIGYSDQDVGRLFPSNCITIANTGQSSVGFPNYQEKPFYATNNVTVLVPKFKCNKYIGLFFCTLIKHDRYKYSWGRVLNENRINTIKVKLPADRRGNPAWKFMEDYIKTLPYSSNL